MIVDWKLNCEHINRTKTLTDQDPSDAKYKYKQELIYLKYLMNIKKMDKQKCYREWLKITNGTASIFRTDKLGCNAQFNKMYQKANNYSYTKLNYAKRLEPIHIYKQEIDFLNNLDAPLWVRQYWACLLFYYKFESQNTQRVQKSTTLNTWCIKHTDIKTKRYGSKCQDIIAQYKNKLNIKVINDYIKIGRDHYSSYKPDFIQTDGEVIYTAKTINEIDKFLKLIKPSMNICTKCGKEFIKTPRTQRTICEECYYKHRREIKNNCDRKRRNKQN